MVTEIFLDKFKTCWELSPAIVRLSFRPASNLLRRMKKKELLNQYYGIATVVPMSEAGTNGPCLRLCQTWCPR